MGCLPSKNETAAGSGSARQDAPVNVIPIAPSANVSAKAGVGAGAGAGAVEKPAKNQPLVLVTRLSCPFTARLATVMTFKGVPFTVMNVGPADVSPPWVFDSSPDGSVPILMRVLEDGRLAKAFPEGNNSGKAIEWLEQQYPTPTLYPEGHRDTIEEWAKFADTELKIAIAKNMLASPFPMQEEWRPKLKAALKKLNEGLAEHNPNKGPYFLGNTFSLIDVMAVSFVERIPALKYFRNFEPDYENLPHFANYHRSMAEWPAWKPNKYDPAVLLTHLKTVNKLPPLSMTRLQHNSFRTWSKFIAETGEKAKADPSDTNVNGLLHWLDVYVTLLEAHTIMENDILLLRLEEIKPGCTAPIRADHDGDAPKLQSLTNRMKEASEAKEGSEVKKAAVEALTKEANELFPHLNEHYTMEEKNIGPVLKEIPKPKHPEVFTRCLSHYKGEVNRKCLPAILQVLGPAWAAQYVLNYYNAGKGTGDMSLWEDVVSVIQTHEDISDSQREDLMERIPALKEALEKQGQPASTMSKKSKKRRSSKK